MRAAEGRLAFVKTGNDTFATREWLAADADPRNVKDDTLKNGLACDRDGCIGRLADGTLVAVAFSPAAFAEDCRRATLVLSPRQGPTQCDAMLIDRGAWRAGGALALRRVGQGFDMIVTRPPGYDRPWMRGPNEASATPTSVRPAPRDATPRGDDLEPGD
jgi:competence protein ComEC